MNIFLFQTFFTKCYRIFLLVSVRLKEMEVFAEFGMMFEMPADYDIVTWYGMGPEVNYCDRVHGARLGKLSNQVSDYLSQ